MRVPVLTGIGDEIAGALISAVPGSAYEAYWVDRGDARHPGFVEDAGGEWLCYCRGGPDLECAYIDVLRDIPADLRERLRAAAAQEIVPESISAGRGRYMRDKTAPKSAGALYAQVGPHAWRFDLLTPTGLIAVQRMPRPTVADDEGFECLIVRGTEGDLLCTSTDHMGDVCPSVRIAAVVLRERGTDLGAPLYPLMINGDHQADPKWRRVGGSLRGRLVRRQGGGGRGNSVYLRALLLLALEGGEGTLQISLEGATAEEEHTLRLRSDGSAECRDLTHGRCWVSDMRGRAWLDALTQAADRTP